MKDKNHKSEKRLTNDSANLNEGKQKPKRVYNSNLRRLKEQSAPARFKIRNWD